MVGRLVGPGWLVVLVDYFGVVQYFLVDYFGVQYGIWLDV